MNQLDQLLNVSGKVVVVTGAMGQLGSKICQAFRGLGAVVVGVDLEIQGDRCDGIHYYKLDITKKTNVVRVFDLIVTEMGGFEVLINNAGVSTFEPFEERTEDSFDWVMGVNLKGSFLCIQAFVNIYDRLNFTKGSIVNVSSMYGVISPDFRIYTDCKRKNSEVYGASKAGIIQMTRYFAVHLAGRNIRVNAVSPGGVFNPKNPQGEDFVKNYSSRCPMGRMANDEEIVGTVIYFASDMATYTTGQNLVVDGGMTCW